MQELVELRVTVSRIESVTFRRMVYGVVSCGIILSAKSEEIVTDRLLVSDEAVRVMDTRN